MALIQKQTRKQITPEVKLGAITDVETGGKVCEVGCKYKCVLSVLALKCVDQCVI